MNNQGNIRKVRHAFDGRRRLAKWRNNHFGGMSAVQAHPLMALKLDPGEGATVTTDVAVNLAPVSGYMRTNAYCHVVQVFVPYQAIEKLELEEQEDAGVTEMTRRRLEQGQGIGLEDENVFTKAMNIHPISNAGQNKVVKSARLAYIAAVNHLRKASYHLAATAKPQTVTDLLPAVLTANILERMNGVLDPERNIDGAINLTGDLPVKGIGFRAGNSLAMDGFNVRETGDGDPVSYSFGRYGNHSGEALEVVFEDDGGRKRPNIRVDMSGTSELTLRDMMVSQTIDKLIRGFAQIIQDDKVNGEAKVARALYSLQVDYDSNCQVLYDQIYELTPSHHRPTDGPSVNDVSAHFALEDTFSVVAPTSELGGELITIAMIKPLETKVPQPDPRHTRPWKLVNIVQDETQLEEELLTRRELEVAPGIANEDAPAMWVGHNALLHDYSTVGPNEQQIFETEMKSTMWTFPVPTSVTPENVSYPADGIDMYPFHNWNGRHAEYTIDQRALISTTHAKGPNPIERIELFRDQPELLEQPEE